MLFKAAAKEIAVASLISDALRAYIRYFGSSPQDALNRAEFRGAALSYALRAARSDKTASDQQVIAESGLFDFGFYRAQTGVWDTQGAAAICHYLSVGVQEGMSPHPAFDGETYLRLHPDVAAVGINPFVHFLRYGVEEGRLFYQSSTDHSPEVDQSAIIRQSGLFDEDLYRRRYSIGQQDAIQHYLLVGGRRGLFPHSAFNGAAYLKANPDVAAADVNPFYHFLRYGVVESRPLRLASSRLTFGAATLPAQKWWHRIVGALLNRWGIRVVRPALPYRIGHLVEDFGGYIRGRLLSANTRKPIYIVEAEPCNRVVLDYFRQYLTVVDGRAAEWCRGLLGTPGLVDDLEHDYAYTMDGASPCFAIQAAWGARPPLFRLTEEHAAIGRARLRELGLPDDAWFVCFHAREGGYSTGDAEHQAYRDVEVETYLPAVREIVRRGGWCIRMGDASMRPLPKIQGMLDYARSPLKSDLMDVVLCSQCRFFLGSSSGLFLLSSIFGVPSALANMAPLGSSYSFLPADLSIPKLYLGADGSAIPFPHILNQPIADFRWTALLDEAGITLKSNTAEEILALSVEMLERLGGTYATNEAAEERQARFRSMFGPNNYSWGSAARIGNDFLERHAVLLEQPRSEKKLFNPIPWGGGVFRNPAAGTRRRTAVKL